MRLRSQHHAGRSSACAGEPRQTGPLAASQAGCAMSTMNPITIYVPRDSGALALGADETAAAIVAEAQRRGLEITLVRNGSRGMFWLEPLVEVATEQGRIAFGPVEADD